MSSNPILADISQILSALPSRNPPDGPAARQDRLDALNQYKSQREALDEAVSEVSGEIDNLLQLLGPHNPVTLLSISDYLTAVATAFHNVAASRSHKLYSYMQRSEQRKGDAAALKQLAGRKAAAFERWANRPTSYTLAQARLALSEIRTAVGNLASQPDAD